MCLVSRTSRGSAPSCRIPQIHFSSDEDAQLVADTSRYYDGKAVMNAEGSIDCPHEHQADGSQSVPGQSQSFAESFYSDMSIAS